MAITFEEARSLLAQEEAVVTAYNIMLANAQEYFENHTIGTRSEEDQIMFRKIMVCDHRRETQPEDAPYMTDQEIIDHIQQLEERYEADS